MTPGNLAAVLEAGDWGDRIAFLDGERTATHRQVHAQAARAAGWFTSHGLGRGDRVLIVLPDGLEFVWSFLGAVRLGAIAIPVNPRLTAADHRHVVADAEPRLVICPSDLADRFGTRPVLHAAALEGAVDAALDAYAPVPDPADVSPGDPAYAQYTSGTTGLPRAAVHTHRDPLAYYEAFARPAIALRPEDVVLSVSKLYFAYGLGNALFFPLLAGCAAVLHGGHPRPDDVADLVERHAVTVLFSVPTFYAHLVAGGRGGALRTVRVAVSAGEPLVPSLAERARALLGCPILDGIGSTEVGQTFASNTLDVQRDGTVGRALPPYRVSVRDSDRRAVAAGQVGDLWVAGPSILARYLNPASRPPERDGEWLCTGDRASLDGDGFLHLHGRADDIELVGGISVAPIEIEAVLARHPAVTEVAVAAVVDERGASTLRAYAVMGPNGPGDRSGRDRIEADLVQRARAELAPFKVPQSVTFVDALPRTPTGKLRRFVLRGGQWPAEASPSR